jgi:hypothetical protein
VFDNLSFVSVDFRQSLQSTSSSSSDDRNRRDHQIQDCRLPPGATIPPQQVEFVDDESADTIELAQQRDDEYVHFVGWLDYIHLLAILV